MYKSFESFKEICKYHPLDGKANYKYIAHEGYIFCLTLDDLKLAREKYPHGWWDAEASKWFYWNIYGELWYDNYIYNGYKWFLGIETWDGIVQVNEPEWGTQRAYNIHKTEIGVFKTFQEAEEFRNKKMKARLEF